MALTKEETEVAAEGLLYAINYLGKFNENGRALGIIAQRAYDKLVTLAPKTLCAGCCSAYAKGEACPFHGTGNPFKEITVTPPETFTAQVRIGGLQVTHRPGCAKRLAWERSPYTRGALGADEAAAKVACNCDGVSAQAAPAPITAVNIDELSDEQLRQRYRQMRGWLISCLRGNNYDLDEDALLHTIWPEDSADYRAGKNKGPEITVGKPCGIANSVVVYLDDVKSGKLTAQQAIDSLDFMAEANGWREAPEQCGQCGAVVQGHHTCQGVPGDDAP